MFYLQLLNVSAIVLANLCVSYIMTSQNEEAEDLMRKIEKEEERIIFEEPNKKTFHLCIVNLVIGYVKMFQFVYCKWPLLVRARSRIALNASIPDFDQIT